MAVMIGQLPTPFRQGQRSLSAGRMNNWLDLTRAIAGVTGGNGVRVRQTRSGWTISGPRRTPSLPIGGARGQARITGYSPGHDHYMGRLVNWKGEDFDPDGDPIDLYCRRGKPDAEPDIRGYWPFLIALDGELTDTPYPVYAVMGDDGTGEPERRWYVDAIFQPWCEDAARQGRPPTFPRKPPLEPDEPDPGGPLDPDIARLGQPAGDDPAGMEPDELKELADRLRGRPCNGCGDA